MNPKWLDCSVLLNRAGKEGEKSYRSLVEDRIRQGEEVSGVFLGQFRDTCSSFVA
jgi:hypothetical protein